MIRVALILLGSSVVSVLLIIFSSFSTAKRSDEAIEQMLRKRRSKLNKENESGEPNNDSLPSIEKIEFLREMYPVGTMLNLMDVTRGAKLLTDIRVSVTKVDEFGLIHCKLEDGDMVTLNPETDIFQLMNI
ncbi:MAG: hypothetical protein K0S41_3386 [Anaerocolumna sp.]|jgi:hypothetical protein|nr:hypothetical protein [Anaerocolumna sp.]